MRAPERHYEVAALYKGGATMEEIAELLDMSKGRIQQMIARVRLDGHEISAPSRNIDPLKLIRAARPGRSMREIAQELDLNRNLVHIHMVRMEIPRTGIRHRPRQYSDSQLLERLRALAGWLGHTPNTHEINADPDTPSCTTYVARFGYLRSAQVRAGLVPNQRGRGRL